MDCKWLYCLAVPWSQDVHDSHTLWWSCLLLLLAQWFDEHIINEIISARQHNEKPDTDTSEGGVDINALVDDIFWWGIITASPKEKNLYRRTY